MEELPFHQWNKQAGLATRATPAVLLFGSAAHGGGHRLAIWERADMKILCVVLGDKTVLVRAFVMTRNHQREDFDLYIHNIIIISVPHTSVLAHCWPRSPKCEMSLRCCKICQTDLLPLQFYVFIACAGLMHLIIKSKSVTLHSVWA